MFYSYNYLTCSADRRENEQCWGATRH